MFGSYKQKRIQNRILSFALIISMLFSLTACNETPKHVGLSDPTSQVVTEDIEGETILKEEVLNEFITSEIYLQEIVIAENKISELLLEEETINEVLVCKTIYVPQDNIEEFANNSQTAGLFGEGIEIGPLLKKIAVGTGVIVTLVVLKKAGLPEPIASMVVAAADESLQFAGTGAAIGTLFGGLTGATDVIDETGRTTAIIAFATATAGLILSIISLVAIVPSGGSTTITGAVGVKLIIAGVSVLAATAGTLYSAYNAVKTFQSTDSEEIDWDNIDWEKVGVASAEQAIENSADGYMWGSIVGAVHGGANGYDFYQKYNTPYSSYNARLVQTPVSGGKWSGVRGESDFILDEPLILPDGTKVTKVTYNNCVPDFSPFQKAQVKISSMTNVRDDNFKLADEALAEYWTKIKYDGKEWTARDVKTYRKDNNLTWHEMNNMDSMQLVPTEVNAKFGHLGGVGEYNCMIGDTANDFE